ncbi:hypothetical protein ACRS4M_10565 [Streptococcus pneumoniae]
MKGKPSEHLITKVMYLPNDEIMLGGIGTRERKVRESRKSPSSEQKRGTGTGGKKKNP